ncbi:hypothetical protein GpartN1_g1179.t1 [Galdieria partita]|uniref:Uncharacterized protein n=1 Tax=Galdieria partita TaxID=83374 RepID=A0A9C7PRM4_9RHOD|nr:hypothetical protein GpartN1_g1179.t1 [Galdieria partita]
MNRGRKKASTKITVEEPSSHSCLDRDRAETANVRSHLSTPPWWQQEDRESYLSPYASLVSIDNWESTLESSVFRGTVSAFDRMNQLFDKDSQPDIKIFSSSSSRKVDRQGNVVEQQVTLTSRYKEASKILGYRRNGVSDEEEVFYHRQLGQRGRETRKVREGSEYKIYDNYLNFTPEDSDTFETEWQNQYSDTETHSIPIHFLDERE